MEQENDEDEFIKENPIIFKKYRVKKKLGEGAFGDVYLGQSIHDNDYVAIKTEIRKIIKPILETEAFLLYSIAGPGIPEVKSFGKTKKYNILVEPLLGRSLFDFFTENPAPGGPGAGSCCLTELKQDHSSPRARRLISSSSSRP